MLNVTHTSILDRFKSIYETLHNSAGTETAMDSIKERLRTLITLDSLLEVDKVTGGAVKGAAPK